MAEFLPFPRDFAVVTGSKRVFKGSVYDITGEVADDADVLNATAMMVIKRYVSADDDDRGTIDIPVVFNGSSYHVDVLAEYTADMDPYPYEYSIKMGVNEEEWVIAYGRVLVTAVPGLSGA
jgi:hypothetical protein